MVIKQQISGRGEPSSTYDPLTQPPRQTSHPHQTLESLHILYHFHKQHLTTPARHHRPSGIHPVNLTGPGVRQVLTQQQTISPCASTWDRSSPLLASD